MTPHVHLSPVQMLAALAFTIAGLGTIHLLALTQDNRASRAWVSLGL